MLFNTYVLCYVLTTSYNTSVEILHDTKKSRDRLISIHFILPETSQKFYFHNQRLSQADACLFRNDCCTCFVTEEFRPCYQQ